MHSTSYERSRINIKEADTLIIDEIGMISAKMFSEVELLCRTVKQNNLLFGGIQVIGCGSFYQLPPVPSSGDPGKFAFESEVFNQVFPHKIIFQSVHRQKELDFIRAINELCEGNPSPRTDQLMCSLKKDLTTHFQPLYIFGTNYDVEFFNHMKLQQLQGQDILFTSEDNGDKVYFRRCGANKYLLLKKNCKVVVTRNLYNGLVNGIGGQVIEISEDSVKIQVDADAHFQNCLHNKVFDVSKYTFVIRDLENRVVAVRKQLPLKLGHAVTR